MRFWPGISRMFLCMFFGLIILRLKNGVFYNIECMCQEKKVEKVLFSIEDSIFSSIQGLNHNIKRENKDELEQPVRDLTT